MPKKDNCSRHPKANHVCRVCLVENLREFRHANVKQGLRLASTRINRLREKHLPYQGTEVNASTVVADLGKLLAELEAVSDRISDTAVDPSAIQHALPSTVSK